MSLYYLEVLGDSSRCLDVKVVLLSSSRAKSKLKSGRETTIDPSAWMEAEEWRSLIGYFPHCRALVPISRTCKDVGSRPVSRIRVKPPADNLPNSLRSHKQEKAVELQHQPTSTS